MKFVSTRGHSPPQELEGALLGGLAPDGGLFMPERIPRLPESFFAELAGRSLTEIADEVASLYLTDTDPDERRALLADALDFDIPLVRIADDLFVLELFHGPTLAFKDVGARFMARLTSQSIRQNPRTLTILVATSGDTGSAVAQAFFGVDGIRVAILYPEGRVSRLQEAQFTTLGGNVTALAVDGDFDDCQRLVKEAFLKPELGDEFGLTSANSINIARLLPQMFYYFHAVGQLGGDSQKPLFSTPSGNFGNLTAGLMARFMGLSCRGFVAATNINDSVPRYLESGRFVPRKGLPTISNAMDVGNPSNFQRILWLFDGNLDRMRREIFGSRYTDEETREAIYEVHSRHGYLLDPHTAVGYLGLRDTLETLDDHHPGIILATAHPAKFREEIESTLGIEVEIPERLARCLELPKQSVRIAAELDALASALRD